MVAVDPGGVAGAVVQCVADNASPAGIGAIDPVLATALLQEVVEVEVADPWLDEHCPSDFVVFEDAVHPLQIQHHAAREHRRGPAVAKVLAGGDRIDRDAPLVRNTHDLLHLLGARRRYGGGNQLLVGLAPERRIGVAVESDVLVTGEHPLGPHDRTPGRQGPIKGVRAHSRRRHHQHPPLAPPDGLTRYVPDVSIQTGQS